MRYEATVGAGLPIIDTFRKLVETGDRVLRIEGCVSGTLMFVLSAVSAGRPFSEAVREAVDAATPSPIRATTCRARDAARKGADPRRGCWAIAARRRWPRIWCRARCGALPLDAFLERLPRSTQAGARASSARRRAAACCATW